MSRRMWYFVFMIAEAVSGAIDGLIKIGSYGLLIWLVIKGVSKFRNK